MDVPDSLVTRDSDGRYWFMVRPDSLSIKPDYRVRFRSDVSDRKGNGIDTTNLHWSTIVDGAPRPYMVEVVPPSRIPLIPASERNRTAPGGILIKATNGKVLGGKAKSDWWEPGRGYVPDTDPTVRSVCYNEEYCNGPTLYINRPARMIIYVYDNTGTFVTSRTIDIGKDDIANMNPDQLDRLSIDLEWNHRNSDGQLVASGVYLWRIVSYLKIEGLASPVMTNQLYRVGVKIRSENGIF